MKIKLTCVYGEYGPGDEVEVSAEEGKRLIEIANAGSEVVEDAKPAKSAKSTKE